MRWVRRLVTVPQVLGGGEDQDRAWLVLNTLIGRDCGFAGHVDPARPGVADRWADLAIAIYSIGRQVNFGCGFDELFFRAYGVEPDRERIRVYRELWDAG